MKLTVLGQDSITVTFTSMNETVTISVTCSDGATLGQGTTQYKCRKCGKTLNAHSKECAMKTTAESEELDLSELDAMQREADNKVYALQSQISALEKENSVYTMLITVTKYGRIRNFSLKTLAATPASKTAIVPNATSTTTRKTVR